MYFRLSFQSFSHRSYMTLSRRLYFDVTMYAAGADYRLLMQLFRERLSENMCTLQSREGNMGYHQYTVPDTVAVEPTFVAFRNRKHTSMSCR